MKCPTVFRKIDCRRALPARMYYPWDWLLMMRLAAAEGAGAFPSGIMHAGFYLTVFFGVVFLQYIMEKL